MWVYPLSYPTSKQVEPTGYMQEPPLALVFMPVG